jgi:putative component of membrane protein insertase Oxa1/YidC/SpoIIIJ protein YidD
MFLFSEHLLFTLHDLYAIYISIVGTECEYLRKCSLYLTNRLIKTRLLFHSFKSFRKNLECLYEINKFAPHLVADNFQREHFQQLHGPGIPESVTLLFCEFLMLFLLMFRFQKNVSG